MKKKSVNKNISGILLLAKKSGITSFSSLGAIKKSLQTSKVGHTGTLDSFADGLLVVLAGSLTRLVPHITNFDKTYLALIEFGSETDTLDPTGNVIKTGPIPLFEQLKTAIQKFKGQIDQMPPAFSALHVNGKRASDLARSGEKVELKSRKITVHSIEILDFYDKYALIEVSVSKGTYIRSLARDIAAECGTCAHLKALRRTKVGPFELKDAAGYKELKEFSIQNILNENSDNSINNNKDSDEFLEEIRNSVKDLDFNVAKECGFFPAILSNAFVQDFKNGRKLRNHSFLFEIETPPKCELAVFYPDLAFAGIIKKNEKQFSYGFVVPREFPIKVFSWEQILQNKFDKDLFQKGTTLSIGSFDGTHIGHEAIFNTLIENKKNSRGIVTFRHSTRVLKSKENYLGDVSTLNQRMNFFVQKGFDFVVVIDFCEEFTKMSGEEFFTILKNNCNLKSIVEGEDFCCGYKGSTDIPALKDFCQKNDVELSVISFVDYLGKKVSSSRIRQDVLNKKFEAVSIMLKTSFEIDCCGFNWKNEIYENQKWLVSKICGMQVFPPDGTYFVNVKLVISGSEEVSDTKTATCKLDSGVLRLLVSDGFCSKFVRSIQFF